MANEDIDHDLADAQYKIEIYKTRIAADRDFEWLRADLAFAAKQRATKSVSMNEADRRKEKEAFDALAKARKARQ